MRFLSMYGKCPGTVCWMWTRKIEKRKYIEKYRLHNNTKYIYGHSLELLSELEKSQYSWVWIYVKNTSQPLSTQTQTCRKETKKKEKFRREKEMKKKKEREWERWEQNWRKSREIELHWIYLVDTIIVFHVVCSKWRQVL